MREVIRIQEEKTAVEDPVKFTDYFDAYEGWESFEPETGNNYAKIVYLGKCESDGDMFAVYRLNGEIDIFKGYLNSGKY